MKKLIIVNRIDLADNTVPLDEQINNLCEVNFAAGYELVSTFICGGFLVLLFRRIV